MPFPMKASTSAFAWNGDFKNGPPHVYISLVGNVQPRLLTPENETGVVPAWSPDGQSIAYVGRAKGQDTELRVIPALGGPSRKIASGSFYGTVSWSPDSKWLLWSEVEKSTIHSIYVGLASGGEQHKLFDPPASVSAVVGGDAWPALSPDGRQLVFLRVAGQLDSDLYLADFDSGRIVGGSWLCPSKSISGLSASRGLSFSRASSPANN